MKKTYSRNQKSKKKDRNPPPWALEFLKENSGYASSSILNDLKRINHRQQASIEKYAIHILADRRLRGDEKLRSGAVRLIVALLPKTFPILKKLLSNSSMSLWYEIHFTLFSALDRRDMTETDQEQVLALLERYLVSSKSQAGFAAWKAGDILGDEWHTSETVAILERVLGSARFVAGRKAALHGIQHAMNESNPSERERLLSAVRRVASEDPSAEVRDYATYTLTNGGCFKQTSVKK